MYYLSSLIAFAALVAAQANDPTISTPPAVVQCQPAQITFTATKTPVFISILPGGQSTAAPLQDLGQQNASPFTWVANLPADTDITLQIRDSSGALAYSAPIKIQSSSDSSCLGAGASVPASSAGPSSSASSAAQSASSAASSASTSAAAVTSSVVSVTSSIGASVSSALSSATATAPPSSSNRPTSSTPSSTRTATVTSTTPTPSPAGNSARSNMQIGFAGLVGLAVAAVMA